MLVSISSKDSSPKSKTGQAINFQDGPDIHDKVTITMEAGEWDTLLKDNNRHWARTQADLRTNAYETLKTAIPNSEKRRLQRLAEMQAKRPILNLGAIDQFVEQAIGQVLISQTKKRKNIDGVSVLVSYTALPSSSTHRVSIYLELPSTSLGGERVFRFEQSEYDALVISVSNYLNLTNLQSFNPTHRNEYIYLAGEPK